MRSVTARRVAAVVVVALMAAACGGHSDHDRIDSLVRDYLDAFASRDAARLAGFFDSSCHVTTATMRTALAGFGSQRIEAHVDRVDVSDLTSSTADVTATGTLTVGSRTFRLSGVRGRSQFHVVKEHGEWKIANCPGSGAASNASGGASP